MTRYGFGHIPEKGYISFQHELEQGAWKDIAIASLPARAQLMSGTLLFETSRPQVWKLRAYWTIEALKEALGISSNALDPLDADWDRHQRRLNFTLGAAAEDPDPAKSAAAERLRAALLLGNGTAQTNLGYDGEVDFGRQQFALTTQGPLASDSQLLGIGGLIQQISQATEALANGLGRSAGDKRSAGRATRIREALSACTGAFNAIYDEITWFLEHTEPGPAHDQLAALRAPFAALLDRYPPPRAKGEPEPSVPPEPPTQQQ